MEVPSKFVAIFVLIGAANAVMRPLEVFFVYEIGEANFNEYGGIQIPQTNRSQLCDSAATQIQNGRVPIVGPGASLVQKVFRVTFKDPNPNTKTRAYMDYNMVRCKDGSYDALFDFYILQVMEGGDYTAIYFEPRAYLAEVSSNVPRYESDK